MHSNKAHFNFKAVTFARGYTYTVRKPWSKPHSAPSSSLTLPKMILAMSLPKNYFSNVTAGVLIL